MLTLVAGREETVAICCHSCITTFRSENDPHTQTPIPACVRSAQQWDEVYGSLSEPLRGIHNAIQIIYNMYSVSICDNTIQ